MKRAYRILALALLGGAADAAWAQTTVPIDQQTFPVTQRLAEPVARATFAVDGDTLRVTVDVVDAQASALRRARRAPDAFLERDTRLVMYFDGSGSAAFARVFGITPAGGLLDGTYREGGEIDSGADFRWRAEAADIATGWRATFQIPLDQLQIAAGATPKVHFEYFRSADDLRIYASGNPRERSGCRLCVAVPLTALAEAAVAPARWQAELGGYYGETKTAAGRDETARPTVSAILRAARDTELRATLYPNFAETEPDFPQLRRADRFSPSLTERRQFFARGQDALALPGFELFNTRSVVAPRAAAAAEHRGESLRALAIAADDSAGVLVEPGAYGNDVLQNVPSRLALARAVWSSEAGSLGVGASSRRFDAGGDSEMLEVDGARRFGAGWQARGLVATSRSSACAAAGRVQRCAPFTGTAGYLRVERTLERGDFGLSTRAVDADFRAAAGWMPQAGYRQWRADASRFWELEGASVQRVSASPSFIHERDEQGRMIQQEIELPLQLVGGFGGLGLTFKPMARLRLVPELAPVDARTASVLFIASPGARLSKVALLASFGELPDYGNAASGRGASLGTEWVWSPRPDFGAQFFAQSYRTRARGAAFDRDTYREAVAQFNANWQFAALSRLRYVGTFGRLRFADLVSRETLRARETAQSLLLEHAPRLGWGATVGLTEVRRTPGGNERQFVVKLRYAL